MSTFGYGAHFGKLADHIGAADGRRKQRHPMIANHKTSRDIVLFLAAVYAITWGLCLLLRARAGGGEVWPLFAWLLPTVWSPTAVALLLVLAGGGRAAISGELQRLRLSPEKAGWLLIAIVLPAAAIVVAVVVARAQGDGTRFIPERALPVMIAIQFLTGAVGEELGWRGFLIPRLRHCIGHVASWWAMATLWSVWHVAGMFFPGTPLQIAPPLLFLMAVLLFGVFLAFIFERTGQSVLATIAAHLSLNISLGIGGALPSSQAFWGTIVVIFGICALVASVWSGKSSASVDSQ